MKKIDAAYSYDGSYTGLLTCIFRCFEQRETPYDIIPHGDERALIYPLCEVPSDSELAARVARGIRARMGEASDEMIRYAYLSATPEREMHILAYIRMGLACGENAHTSCDLRAEAMRQARLSMIRELRLFRRELEMTDYGGVLACELQPRRLVLPLLAPWCFDRLHGRDALLLDATHGMAAAQHNGVWRIVPLESFLMPLKRHGGLSYAQLWHRFFESVVIQRRYDPRCRLSTMPPQYWDDLTDFAQIREEHGQRLIGVAPSELDEPSPSSEVEPHFERCRAFHGPEDPTRKRAAR